MGGYLDVHDRRPGTRETEKQLVIESLPSYTSYRVVCSVVQKQPRAGLPRHRYAEYARCARCARYAIRDTHCTQHACTTPFGPWATVLLLSLGLAQFKGRSLSLRNRSFSHDGVSHLVLQHNLPSLYASRRLTCVERLIYPAPLHLGLGQYL